MPIECNLSSTKNCLNVGIELCSMQNRKIKWLRNIYAHFFIRADTNRKTLNKKVFPDNNLGISSNQ